MWATNPDAPADCGRRLLPVVIDQRARNEPDSPWCSLPVDDYDLSKGFEDISISRLAKAINQLAWFIESAIGRSSTFETVAYLGVGDIRYHLFQMAVCKTGHKVLFSSQINSKDIHVSLMEQTGCNTLFSGEGVHVGDILAAKPLKHVVVPSLEELLDMNEVPHYPYDKSFDEAKNDPFVILHTSGTTGMPKAVVWNHAIMATQDQQQLVGDQAGRKPCLALVSPGEGVRYLLPTPPPHALPEGSLMIVSVFNKAVVVPGFRHRTVNPSELAELLPWARCTKGALTPWMMEDIARRSDAEELLKNFELVAFGGAVLSVSAAKVWSKYTKIQNIYGSTESSLAPILASDPEDYDYIYFNTFLGTFYFHAVDNTGYLTNTSEGQDLYELVMETTEDAAPVASWHAHQNIDPTTTPGPYPEWHTGDLWTPHPDPEKAAFAWKFICRKDDLISFSTGVNGNPTPLERAITDTATQIRAAIVVGDRHQQTVAVLELAGEESGGGAGAAPSAALAAELWDAHVQPANELAQTNVRVARTHVLLVPAGTFVRTGKGSVVRNKTQAKLSGEIEEVYRRFGDEWHDAKDRYGSISQTTSITVEVAADPDR